MSVGYVFVSLLIHIDGCLKHIEFLLILARCVPM